MELMETTKNAKRVHTTEKNLLGHGGGLVVSVLAFQSDNLNSSNPTEVLVFKVV